MSNDNKLKYVIQGIKVVLPNSFQDDFTEDQFMEWFNFETSICKTLSEDNPLRKVKISDCKRTFDRSLIYPAKLPVLN